MKKFKSLEKILLVLFACVCICLVATVSKATTGNPEDIMNIPYINGNEANNETQNQPANNETQNIAGVGENNTTNTALPALGANDTMMWIAVGVCVIAAIYTYKKVRDYNV